MKIDENVFFRESTIRICKSLDIEEAMCSCMKYLTQFMPAQKMYLQHYEPTLGGMRTVATATPESGKRIELLTPLKPEMQNAIQKMRESRRSGNDKIIHPPEIDGKSRQLLSTMFKEETSFIFTFLDVHDQMLGAVVLTAKGKDQYTKEHDRLFSLLSEPFTIAMANARRHTELIHLKNRLVDDNRYLYQELHRMHGEEIIGADFGLKDAMEMVRQVAPLESPVLLLGETGVGKDLIANAIHVLSPRKERPFITVNSGAIPDTLIDSELFGHERGAFTGARDTKRGRFERANLGTIFLDEIGELPPQAQIRLLRVLQNKQIERVGGTKTIPVNVRIIAATHRNLEEMTRTHRFREDLWFRLNVFPIIIPPLRYRKDDIPALVHHFVERKSKEFGFHSAPQLSPNAIEQLMAYHWPGNVRELQNVVERAIILKPAGPLTFNLSPSQRDSHPREGQILPQAQSDESLNLDEAMTRHVKRVLQITGGKIHGPGGAAEQMGIHPNTLRNRMNKLKITYKRYKTQDQ
jgi:transcriptional regulator with GAF, ATPase, and Fis domain